MLNNRQRLTLQRQILSKINDGSLPMAKGAQLQTAILEPVKYYIQQLDTPLVGASLTAEALRVTDFICISVVVSHFVSLLNFEPSAKQITRQLQKYLDSQANRQRYIESVRHRLKRVAQVRLHNQKTQASRHSTKRRQRAATVSLNRHCHFIAHTAAKQSTPYLSS